MKELAVVIPTKNRPAKLEKCLAALTIARAQVDFDVWVCDSSTDSERAQAVKEACARYDFVHLRSHTGTNVATARNFCADVAQSPILVNVDDDIYVYPDSILKLYEKYTRTAGHRVVAGSVQWGDAWSSPVKMRMIGYGRSVREHEKADFFIGAFFIYARELAHFKPWNERIKVADDQYMGALLRAAGVEILFEPEARARHDDEHNFYGIDHLDSHIYANLFDAVIANPRPLRAISYEVLGFLFAAKLAVKSHSGIGRFLERWSKGHRDLMRDWSYLHAAVRSPLPAVTYDSGRRPVETAVSPAAGS